MPVHAVPAQPCGKKAKVVASFRIVASTVQSGDPLSRAPIAMFPASKCRSFCVPATSALPPYSVTAMVTCSPASPPALLTTNSVPGSDTQHGGPFGGGVGVRGGAQAKETQLPDTQ